MKNIQVIRYHTTYRMLRKGNEKVVYCNKVLHYLIIIMIKIILIKMMKNKIMQNVEDTIQYSEYCGEEMNCIKVDLRRRRREKIEDEKKQKNKLWIESLKYLNKKLLPIL